MSKWRFSLRLCGGGIAALALLVGAFFVLRSGARPLCHRAVDGAFQQWMNETGDTNGVYPNAAGLGSNSLALIEPFFGSEIHQYAYVPGLKCDDPQDLVLLYLKSKTPYTWHADQEHTILSPHRWMVVPPGIVPSGTCPEGGDLLDTAELKRRLERTMAFLKQHQRPHWQVVVEEHTAFLKSQLPAHERFR